jgi:hypothetical protein
MATEEEKRIAKLMDDINKGTITLGDLPSEDADAVYGQMVDRQRRKAVGSRARETVFDVLGKGLRMYAGVPLGPGLREQREARGASERAQAREMADQDPFVYRNMYGDKYAEYVNKLSTVAQASLSDEDNEEVERAKLEVQREKDIRDFLAKGGGLVNETDEDLAARRAAASYLRAVSMGGSTQQNMQKTMAGLQTEYALDRYAHWINTFIGEATAVPGAAQATQRVTVGASEAAQGEASDIAVDLTQAEIDEIQNERLTAPPAGSVDPSNTYPHVKNEMVSGGTLKPSPDRLTADQRAAISEGLTLSEATARATAALDKLESMPSLQGAMRDLALQNLTPEQKQELKFTKNEAGEPVAREWTVRETFDKVYGQTQQEAELRDLETVSEIEWAMDRMLGKGDFGPLTSNKAFLEDMKKKGLSPKDYARYVQHNARIKRERPGKTDGELKTMAMRERAEQSEALEQARQQILTEPKKKLFPKSAEAAGAEQGGSGDAGVGSNVEPSEETPNIKVTGTDTSGAGRRGGVRQQIRTNRQEARRAKVAAEVEKRKKEREAKKAQRGDPINLSI